MSVDGWKGLTPHFVRVCPTSPTMLTPPCLRDEGASGHYQQRTLNMRVMQEGQTRRHHQRPLAPSTNSTSALKKEKRKLEAEIKRLRALPAVRDAPVSYDALHTDLFIFGQVRGCTGFWSVGAFCAFLESLDCEHSHFSGTNRRTMQWHRGISAALVLMQ
eukprot:m.35554 g.35554  ORF g.35554 m.35554 type:complete len:160 (+) comp5299_c0_seq1:615-1094(+)